MLKLQNVSKFYYNKGVIASGFSKVNLELALGEFVVITGESGSGKSTLLNVLSGLDSYEEGEMYVNGNETSHYSETDFEEYRRKYIANIFQSFNLVNSYTVYQNIEFALLLNGYKKKQVKKQVLAMIDRVGLSKFKNTKVSKLSGGQKQRVAIARAMVKDTPIVVADEPTGNLDSESARDIIQLLREMAQDRLVIVVTHNLEQVEQYATRIVRMHDGSIVENKLLRQTEVPAEIREAPARRIPFANKLRLGFRNTFNLTAKFILLFAVFLLMTAALLTEYASFNYEEYQASKMGNNQFFRNLTENRIVIQNEDGSPFSSAQYAAIKELDNVSSVFVDDVLLDNEVCLSNNQLISEGDQELYYIYGRSMQLSYLKGAVDLGRLPQNDYEVVLEGTKNDYYIGQLGEQLLGQDLNLLDWNNDQKIMDQPLQIVGIRYNDQSLLYSSWDTTIYVSETVMNNLRGTVNESCSAVKIMCNDIWYESHQYDPHFRLLPNENVDVGCALVSYDLHSYYDSGYCIGNTLNIAMENVYFSDTLDVTIDDTYSRYNFTDQTGLDSFDDYNGAVFINPEDYNRLFDQDSYQSSVFVSNPDLLDQTMAQLNQLGLTTLAMRDVLVREGQGVLQLLSIMKLIVTVALIVTLFFLCYFIIKIILKSRNVYFSTLRILGGTKQAARLVLEIELFVVATLAYLSFLLFTLSIKYGWLTVDFASRLAKYLNWPEFALMYAVLTIMALLIARRFCARLFKVSAMKAYHEEV